MRFLAPFFVLAVFWSVLASADFDEAGQCPSGFPSGGLFSDCSARDWSVAATFDPFLEHNNITFIDDFKSFPAGLGFRPAESNSTGCSVRLGPGTTIFQELIDLPRARMFVQACGRAWGNAGCHVEIRDSHNRVVDHLEFAGAACSGSNSGSSAPCTPFCENGWKSLSVKYVGELASNITIYAEDDPSRSIIGEVGYGGVIELAARNSSYLPSRLVFRTERFGVIDVLDLSCNATSTSSSVVLPGQFFGDLKQFLIDRGTTGPQGDSEQLICPYTDAADDRDLCKCHADDAEEVCMGSAQGFIPEPELSYFIGLVARECTCDFDSACLQFVSEADYLGVSWQGRARVSTSVDNSKPSLNAPSSDSVLTGDF